MESTGSSIVHQRLDALDARLSWFYVRLLLLTGVSWAVHGAEFVLFTFTRRLVAHNVGMGTYALEALGIGVFLGAAVGGPLFGILADARGRRSALLFAMTLSLAGLALSAMAKRDYHVIGARIVAGIGLGGELPAATVLVQELAPRSMRGRMVALLEAFTGVGGVIGVALAFGLAPQLGWRATYLAICGCVLYAGVLRIGIPESPRWLASVGRADEALRVLLSNRFVHTLVLWTLWTVMAVSSYALGVYIPTLISMSGFNMYERWNTIALLHGSQILGCIAASWMLEARGRKHYMPWNRFVVIIGTCSVSALLAGTWSCVLAYTPETFNAAVRSRGVAYAFGFSRLGATGGALLYPHMFDVWLICYGPRSCSSLRL
ncbi:Major Facilitator Superfamily (MFS) [Phytophthora infestans T30-4]|uniref:Major Facilitator Superfamily (MFS) n=1 Tax=Phytophthora infestans (strain T30-4) TaxID=403677 RepID=D0N8Z1_PHYIT|nr:Major Facilitator Superfamily (MFS) [Phytophthora infestans T30-4]EEY54026.1 Major Facilitator Superfamily (MFS) [Phytophthora infestans T30-4]|eukprot:XP_002904657.1 Major Facilitator Superfamily (MFS) [Phytophthora infestans T30-4]